MIQMMGKHLQQLLPAIPGEAARYNVCIDSVGVIFTSALTK